MYKKSNALFLKAAALVISFGLVLSGCGNSSGGEKKESAGTGASGSTAAAESKAEEPLHISVFVGQPGSQPTEDNKIFKLMEEKLNVTFQFEFLVGELEQKLGVMIASGDYPDIISGADKTTKLIDADALIPLEDLIKKSAPNLDKHYSPYYKKMREAKDGKIYVMPNYGRIYEKEVQTSQNLGAFWIQKAVLKEFGYPKVVTLDEYFDLIQKYKEKYPEIEGKPTIGFEILSFDWRAFCLKNPPIFLAGYPNDGAMIVDTKNMKGKMFANTDIAKRYYKKLSEVNQLGLIDKETFVQNYDQYISKIASGRVLGMYDHHWQFADGENVLITQQKLERTYVPLGIVYDKGTVDRYTEETIININRGYGISVKCKEPERVIKVFDELITEEWQKILNWGIKDEDYKVDDKGRFYREQSIRDLSTDQTWKNANKADALFLDAPKMEGIYSDGNSCDASRQPEEFYAGLKPYDKEFLDAYGYKTFADFLTFAQPTPAYYPAWSITVPDGSPAQISGKKADDLQMKYLPKLILSKPDNFESVWDDYVAQFGKIDTAAYENFINEQIDWRMKNWGN